MTNRLARAVGVLLADGRIVQTNMKHGVDRGHPNAIVAVRPAALPAAGAR